jgi:RHS repeat-associated protein
MNTKISSCIFFILFANILSGVYAYTSPPINVTPTNPPIIIPPPPSCETCSACADSTEPSNPAAISFDQGFGRAPWLGIDAPGGKLNIYIPNQGGGGSQGGDSIGTRGMFTYNHPTESRVVRRDTANNEVTVRNPMGFETTYGAGGKPAKTMLSLDKQCTTKANGEVVELLENRTRIVYGADNAPVRIVTPSGVEAQISDFGVEVLKDLGGIRQIWSKADGLLDFTEPSTNSVLVSWYPPSGTSTSKDPATGLYTFSGNPVKTFLFTRTTQQGRRLVSGPGCPACASGKVVYHIQACNSVYETIAGTYNGLVLEERRGSDFLFRYEWQYLGSPNSWSLIKGEGAETVTDSVISLPNIFPGRLQQTRTISSADGSISSVKRELLSYDNRGFISLRKAAVDASGQEQVLFSSARIDQGANAGRLSVSTNAYGGAESYVYDSDGRMTRMTETLQGGIMQVTTNTYSTVRDVDGFADRRPLRTVVTQNGVTISDVAYSYSSTLESVARTDARTGVTLSTLKYFYAPDSANPFERGRVKLTVNPDGSATHYAYAEGENGLWTETVTQGYWYPAFLPPGQTYMSPADITQLFSVLPGKSTRRVSTHDFRGDVVRTESHVHTGSGFTLAGWATYSYNIMHKRLGTERHDGTSDLSNWICTGPVWQRNADGTSVTNTFDTAKRIKTSTRYTPFGNVTKTYDYNADGQVVSVITATNGVTVGCGIGCGSTYSEFDTQGRTVLSVDAMGRTNRTSYSLDNRTITRTDPAGAIVIENYASDGSLLSRTGTVMRAEYYTRGVDGTTGTRWEKTTYGTPTGADYTKSYYNALDQLVLQERPGFGGATLKTVYVYNAKGQLESETRLVQGGTGTYDLPVTTYTYNQLGERSSVTQTARNISRVQSSDNAFVVENGVVQQTSVSVLSCSDVAIPAMTNAAITRLFPLENGVLAEIRQRDVRGNETVQMVVQNTETYVRTTTVSNETSVLPATSISLAGLTLSQTDPHGCTTTYTYDALMRQISAETRSGANNERLTGTYTHYNIIGQVDYTEDAFGSRTVYCYEPGTGRRISTTKIGKTTDPVLTTYTTFDEANRMLATWGATYPVAYAYDNKGNMIAMATTRDPALASTNLWLAVPDWPQQAANGQLDVTRWLYDEATGLLTNKLYSDDKGPSYSYTAIGQLSTRKWARLSSTGQQLLTRYAYDFFGPLTNAAYSDGTPSVTFTINALGQMKTITDASGTRTLDYAADGQMIAEQLAFSTSLFTLHEKFDKLIRNEGYVLSNEVAQISGTMQSFDQFGRLNQVAVDGITNTFVYGYLEGSHLQKTLAMPNGVTRTFGYEANRDQLTLIIHSNATDRLVQRDFSFDGLGRLQNRTLFRANETPHDPDAFVYNNRSELTNAVIGANLFTYAFDPIGNRLAATEFGTNTTYMASVLNQYTSIQSASSAQSADNFLPEFDADGNQTLIKTTTGIWHVTYNAENRPVLFSNETTVVEMAYDYMGRRFEYKETVSSILTRHERYLYRGYLQIAALDMLNSTSVKHTIAWDPSGREATRPLSLQIGANAFFYSFDQVKNVSELFDATGALVASYDYSPFGHVTSFQITQSGTKAITQFSNPLTFSSEVSDFTLGLQYYNYRHLNTIDGRWVNRDPIGEVGDINLNAILANSTLNSFDWLGLIDKDECECGDCEFKITNWGELNLSEVTIEAYTTQKNIANVTKMLKDYIEDMLKSKIPVYGTAKDIADKFLSYAEFFASTGLMVRPKIIVSRNISYEVRKCKKKYIFFGCCKWKKWEKQSEKIISDEITPMTPGDGSQMIGIADGYVSIKDKDWADMLATVMRDLQSQVQSFSEDKQSYREKIKKKTGCRDVGVL